MKARTHNQAAVVSLADAVISLAAAAQQRQEPARVFHAPEGYRRLTINLSHDLHRKLRLAAVEKDLTATDIITHLLETNLR